jgi:hypothetical protein
LAAQRNVLYRIFNFISDLNDCVVVVFAAGGIVEHGDDGTGLRVLDNGRSTFNINFRLTFETRIQIKSIKSEKYNLS